jgi:hypothetical protein
MYKYIQDNYYSSDIPRWMKDTRFERLMLLDRWLDGTFYDAMKLSFNEEKTGNSYNPLHTRRPAVQHNFPSFIAGLCARKLFGGRHVPRLKHKNPDFLLKVQALVQELKMPVKMLETVKRGSVGSTLVLFKFLEVVNGEQKTVKGVVEVKKAQYCTPIFNQFEELTGIMEHYLVSGAEMLQRNMTRDRDGEKIEARLKYWYTKIHDTNSETIYFPLKEHDWNPVDGGKYEPASTALVVYPFDDKQNPMVHGLGFLQGVWIQNLTAGKFPDGLGTWENALNNFVEIDYAKSQNSRGLKYASAPQLVVKGDFRSEAQGDDTEKTPRDPAYLLRLSADEKGMDGMSSTTGHDAFLLETNGAAAKASDDFVSSLKHTTFEQICTARKDLESIKGTMSGKVIELIDEDFLDLLQELRLQYGEYGYLCLVKKICKAAREAGHPLMQTFEDAIIDGLTLDFPPLYLPDAQEIQFLVSAFVEATADSKPGGKGADGSATMIPVTPLIDPVLAAQYLAKQLDLVEESDDKPTITDTDTSTDSQPEPDAQPIEDRAVTPGADAGELLAEGQAAPNTPLARRNS